MTVRTTTITQYLTGALLAAFLLIYLHPYYGIRHDAVLYLGQAILRLNPKNFANDLFFLYGSQANFTIFPQLLALILPHLDTASIFIAFTLFGLFFFAGSSVKLLHTLFAFPQWYWALLALLIFPSTYGGFGVFDYLEGFFTGRSLAQPLLLLAISAFLVGRRAMAGIAWLAAAALHPLQALPMLVIWWIDRVLTDRRWLHLLWLPLVFGIGGAFGFPLAAFRMTPFDAQWLEWIVEPNRHVFISRWTQHDFLGLATGYFLVALLALHGSGAAKKFAKTLLVATPLCFAASFLLVDAFHLILPTQLQIWRIHWLLHWLAVASIPFLLTHYWKIGKFKSIPFWLLLSIVVFGFSTPDNRISVAAGLTSMIIFLLWPHIKKQISSPYTQALLFGLPGALSILMLKYGYATVTKFKLFGYSREVLRPEFVILHQPLLSGLLVGIGIFYFKKLKIPHLFSLIILAILLVYAGTEWDRRTTWTKYIESANSNPALFGPLIEDGSQVFWTEELAAPWLILNRPSYFSGQQMAGILFNRETAKEAFHRIKVMEVVMAQLSTCRLMNELNKNDESCLVDLDAIKDACKNSDGKLKYLIIDTKTDASSFGSWKIKGGPRGDFPITYYAYRCADLTR